MQQSIQPTAEVRNRAARYRDVDGLPYLFTGLTLVFWGISFSLPSRIPSFGTLGGVLTGIATWAPIWLLSYQDKLTEWAKARMTYQRTGYVKYDPQTRTLGVAEVLIVLPVFLLAGAMPFLHSIGRLFFHWVWPISLLFSVVGALLRRKALVSDFVHVLGPVLLGLTCWFIFRPAEPLGSLFIVMGSALVLVGLVRLLIYLRQNPKAQT